jgi:hypothetical protein
MSTVIPSAVCTYTTTGCGPGPAGKVSLPSISWPSWDVNATSVVREAGGSEGACAQPARSFPGRTRTVTRIPRTLIAFWRSQLTPTSPRL